MLPSLLSVAGVEALEFICGDNSKEIYKWMYNILILKLYYLTILALDNLNCAEIEEDTVTNMRVKEKELYAKLDSSVRHHLRKQGLSVIKITNMGCYTEFNPKDIGGITRLASSKLAEAYKFNIKIPQTSRYLISTLNVNKNKNKLHKIIIRNSAVRFNYSKVEATKQYAIKKISRVKSEKYDESMLAGYNKTKKIFIFIKRNFKIKSVFMNKGKDLKLINLWCFFVGWIKDKFFKINSVLVKTSLNICLVLGIVLCLIAPVLIYSFTGFNLYESYSLVNYIPNRECSAADVQGTATTYLFQIRTCLATILFNLILLFFLFNYNKLTGPLAKKAVMGATCVIVRGGFEGLGDPALDENYTTPKSIRTAMPQESQNKNSSGSFPPLNLEVNGVLVSYPPEGSNAKHKEKNTTSGYPFWPNLPESNSEPASTSEDNKKVRINGYTEVKERSELGLNKTKETKYEIIQLEPKNKPQRHRSVEMDNNITDNSYHSNSAEPENKKKKKRNYNFDWHAVFKWEKAYPKKEAVGEENWPEIEVVNPILEEIKRYKSSCSLPTPNLESINGHINNPASTAQIEARQNLKNRLK